MAAARGLAERSLAATGVVDRPELLRLLTALRLARAVSVVGFTAAVAVALTGAGEEVWRSSLAHPVFVLALALAAALAAAAAWTRFRVEASNRSFLLTIAFASLAVLYAPHALFDATHPDANDLMFGPVSRLAFAVLVAGAVAGPWLPRFERLRRTAALVAVVGVGVTIDYAPHSGWFVALYEDDPLAFKNRIEGAALTAEVAAGLLLAVVCWRSRRPFVLSLIGAIAAFGVGSALFIASSPWQARWWIAHLGVGVGAIVLSVGIVEERSRRGTVSAAMNFDAVAQLGEHVVDAMQDGLALHDANGALVAWNPAAERLTGWTRAEAQERLSVDLPGGVTRLGESWVDVHRFDVRQYGRVYRATLFSDANARVVLEDAYQREQEAGQRLRDVDELKTAFVRTVAHDLRTPLTVVRGGAETLVHRAAELDPAVTRQLAEAVVAGAVRLERLVENILDLDRLAMGGVEPRRRATDLTALIRRVVEELGFEERVSVESNSVIADVDPDHVERIIENLLVNADRHTPGGTRIDVGVTQVDGQVVLSVDDRGPGVDDELKEAIFEPFLVADTGGSSGTGVGLSLVRRFAALHGGRAWVEDRDGGGASFRVALPRPASSTPSP